MTDTAEARARALLAELVTEHGVGYLADREREVVAALVRYALRELNAERARCAALARALVTRPDVPCRHRNALEIAALIERGDQP